MPLAQQTETSLKIHYRLGVLFYPEQIIQLAESPAPLTWQCSKYLNFLGSDDIPVVGLFHFCISCYT